MIVAKELEVEYTVADLKLCALFHCFAPLIARIAEEALGSFG